MSAAEKITSLKTPPHSMQAEQSVIGAILTDNSVLANIDGLLSAEMFYRREHKIMYEIMVDLCRSQKPVDVITLSECLQDSNQLAAAGGLEYLAELFDQRMSSINASHYAEIVRNKHLDRCLISAAHAIADMAYNGDEVTQAKIDKAQSLVTSIVAGTTHNEIHINQAMKGAIALMMERNSNQGELIGLSTGFRDLDKQLGGLMPGEMIVVAGRPSMGKSTLAQNFIEHNVLAGKFVIFFSVEMRWEMVVQRHISSVGKIPLENVKRGNINDYCDQLNSVGIRLKDRNYVINDDPMMTSAQILSQARRISHKAGRTPDLIVIDYLQLMSDATEKGGNETSTVSAMSKNIKLAARALDCPIVLLSQLNRDLERRTLDLRRPMLSDLRSSGAIEQDADVVIMLFREEVYDENTRMKGTAEAIVRKSRNGEIGTVYISSLLHMSRFADSTYHHSQEDRRYGLD